jgi:alpha-L-fucosidase 2
MARLEDGEAAYQNVLQLLRQSTRHNLFDVCGLKANSPYQIDGNLGGPTGLIEMLLQSHAGVIRLLPALPKAWPDGSFRGLRARGGLEVDVEWKDGRATNATLRSTLDRVHSIAAPRGQTIVSATQSSGKRASAEAASEITLPMKAGEVWALRFS